MSTPRTAEALVGQTSGLPVPASSGGEDIPGLQPPRGPGKSHSEPEAPPPADQSSAPRPGRPAASNSAHA